MHRKDNQDESGKKKLKSSKTTEQSNKSKASTADDDVRRKGKRVHEDLEALDLPNDDSCLEGLSDLGKEWVQIRKQYELHYVFRRIFIYFFARYYVGTFTIDPRKVKDALPGKRIRALNKKHVQDIAARMVNNPQAVVSKAIYSLEMRMLEFFLFFPHMLMLHSLQQQRGIFIT